ncbi:MAG: radical SAM protein [Chitinispirillaceae bacterium]|nr:radical SAM protein [Chitinispirillaceae bacterium]
MIGISKLYCGTVEPSDVLRYGCHSEKLPSHMLQYSSDKKPVVVWNVTRRCNLKCMHCYSESENLEYDGELNKEESLRFLDSLADFKVPVVLFSGGEPLIRKDVFELISHARSKGMRAVVSTNGTLITQDVALRLKDAGLSYVGVSLDGLRDRHDYFRGLKGAFDRSIEGIRACTKAGVKVGLRFTITRDNVEDIPGVFKLLENEEVPRICFYHLVYTGRAAELAEMDLDHDETRKWVDRIIDSTAELHRKGHAAEVLTVDNHADGVYLYQRMVREKSPHAENVLELLKMNGGNNSGIGIGCVSWDGTVYPDQFWRHYSLGNVREKPFGEIWTSNEEPLLVQLRNRKTLLKGKCSRCIYQNICNGNFRVRAEAARGGLWEEDPACYLTEDEIAGKIG